jgi:hypothetical protein
MSEPYQVFVFMPEALNQEKAVYETHEILALLDAEQNEDSYLILNDFEDEEYDPESLDSLEQQQQALAKLANWPTLGTISYFIQWFRTVLTYYGEPNTGKVYAISLSIPQGSFERHENEAILLYTEIAKKLHDHFHAKRTIMDWGITYKGLDIEDEIKNLRNNKFIGNYQILDVRNDSIVSSKHRLG